MGAIEGGVFWLGVRQWMSSVFGHREGYSYVSALCTDGRKEFLQSAYVSPMGGGGNCYRKVFDVGDHEAPAYRHV